MAGVLSGAARMEGIVAAGLASGKNVNGHARDLAGVSLQAYAAAGISSDHEIMTGSRSPLCSTRLPSSARTSPR